jgi:two-component system sensor histidine kinase DesK
VRLLPENREMGWTPYVWLAYLSMFVAEPFVRPRPAWSRAATLLVALVFLALYFRGWWLNGRRLLPLIAAIVTLGVVCIPWNSGASVFFIYGAAFVGAVGPPQVSLRYLLLIVLVVLLEAYLLALPAYAWIPAATIALVVGGPNIHFMEMDRTRERLRLAQDEVAHMAKVAERERIARDLHDLLGHTLSVVVLKSELASKLTARDPEGAAREIREVEAIARQALSEVRRAVQGYRSRGLAAELASVRPALDAAGIELSASLPTLALPATSEGVLALALREAVTNVARHSAAKRCWVDLRVNGESVCLEVRDDGKGARGAFGSGLLGMRERARALGGELSREVDGGTRLRVSLPLACAPPREARGA